MTDPRTEPLRCCLSDTISFDRAVASPLTGEVTAKRPEGVPPDKGGTLETCGGHGWPPAGDFLIAQKVTKNALRGYGPG